MTTEGICVKFHIEKSDMQYFIDSGILPCGELDDEQLRIISQIVLFLKVGLEKENITKYFFYDDTRNGKSDKARILRTLRESMLDAVHDKQKQLDKIDYIINELLADKSC